LKVKTEKTSLRLLVHASNFFESCRAVEFSF